MRWTVFIVVFSIPLMVASQSLKELDKKNGFRDIELGSKMKKHKCMQKMTPEYLKENKLIRDWDYYNTLCDHKTINGQPIELLLINTSDQKIAEIAIKCKSDRSIIKTLSDLYGEPTYFTPDQNLYYWRSEEIELRVFFDNGGMTVNYKSYGLSLQRDKIKAKEKARKAEEQFKL
ncbi:hypothetical protein MQE36_02525 [Zhouia spongiae]|uniref:Uncharacterized protein n=1 Tax=Zhouia spongiae TaxID=2202721 RepID=A0ABY3YN70_9FLAO|nr:hypothetical protein [Zhouia spongiae]UNY99229.1 hypothetical protein MQE36_02525 [Zhouia spongiae]